MPPKKAPATKTKKSTASTTKKPSGATAKKDSKGSSDKPGAAGGAQAAVPEEAAKNEGFSITLKQLGLVLDEPMDTRLAESGKFPLILDASGLVSTFLRHRDCNYLDALDQSHLEPERVRMAVIGAIRFGKPLVVDLMEADLFDTCRERFDAVQAGLMQSLLDKSILKDEKYLELVKDSDGDLYKDYLFEQKCLEQFRFVVVSKSEVPPPSVGNKMYPVTVKQN